MMSGKRTPKSNARMSTLPLTACLARNSVFGFLSDFGIRFSDFVRHVLVLGTLLLCRSIVGASTNTSVDAIPPLRPPHDEITPGFWEERRSAIIIGSVVFAFCIVAATWFIRRPRQPAIVPPEVQARDALNALSVHAEDGALLSKVTQILRKYITDGFALPPGEVTTTEFCRMIAEQERIGSELAGPLCDFLRRCDERKFAPLDSSPSLEALSQALHFIELAEARREALKVAVVKQ